MPPPKKPGAAAYVSNNPGMGGTIPASKTKTPEQIAREKAEDEAAMKAFLGDSKPGAFTVTKDPAAPVVTPEEQAAKLRQQEEEQKAILKQQYIQDHLNKVDNAKLDWLARQDALAAQQHGKDQKFRDLDPTTVAKQADEVAAHRLANESREQKLARADQWQQREVDRAVAVKGIRDFAKKALSPMKYTPAGLAYSVAEKAAAPTIASQPKPGYTDEDILKNVRQPQSFVRDTPGNQRYIGEKELEQQKIQAAIKAAREKK